MLRRMLAAAAGATLALALAACGGSSKTSSADTPTTIKIMVGGLNKQIYLPAMLTQQLGFFKAQGLNVELSDEPSGVSAEDAMLAGQVDAVVGFYDHNIDLQSKGKATESVVQFSQVPGEVELCRTDVADQIRSPADWKGRKLGVTGLGSSTNFLTKYLAVHNGLSVTDITSVAVEAGQTFLAAMQPKKIDCGMPPAPTHPARLGAR